MTRAFPFGTVSSSFLLKTWTVVLQFSPVMSKMPFPVARTKAYTNWYKSAFRYKRDLLDVHRITKNNL